MLFHGRDGRNAGRRHGRAAAMGCRSGEPSSSCFWLGKSGWLGSLRRGGAHQLVGWGPEVLAPPVAVANPLPGLRLPPPASVSRDEKEEGGHQVGRAGCLGRGPWPSAGPAQQVRRRRLELLPCRASSEAEEREKELMEEEKKREGAK